MKDPVDRRHARTRPRRRARAGSAGFTLLELLIVIIILGLLGALAGPQLIKYLGKAKTDTAKLQIDQIEASLDLFFLDAGRYPTQQEGLQALVERPAGAEQWNGPYLKKRDTIVDPWGKTFEYSLPGEHGPYDIYSLGSDGAEGGDGEDQDVTSW
ncbi:MAG: type II secretion system major pseudopilin GspG [Kiloniellales bacterium]|nr:type II secretion system major pseudopilin GspG [Kiloniellales bacterium]